VSAELIEPHGSAQKMIEHYALPFSIDQRQRSLYNAPGIAGEVAMPSSGQNGILFDTMCNLCAFLRNTMIRGTSVSFNPSRDRNAHARHRRWYPGLANDNPSSAGQAVAA